ncbi:MAG: copper amine oxidase N-terminal domain-containing protein [Defluviitaleaceae bacterium]|nr:copper amine oxidase N-terminal domain-containing protein [Defluviitaleaceae bacterium]
MIKYVKSALLAALILAMVTPKAVYAVSLPGEPQRFRIRTNILEVNEEHRLVTVYRVFGQQPLTLNITDETIIIDAVSNRRTSLSERVDDMVTVDHGRIPSYNGFDTAFKIIINEPAVLRTQANIVDVDESGGRVTVRQAVGGRVVELNITDDTFIVDAISGMNTKLDERENNAVLVYRKAAATFSEPLVSDAVVIVVNVLPEYTLPTRHVVDFPGIITGAMPYIFEWGRLSLDIGEFGVHIDVNPSGVEPIRLSTGEIILERYIGIGSEILIWWHDDNYRRRPRRIVLLTYGDVSTDEMRRLRTPITEEIGYTLSASLVREVDGEIWVPLRQVAEGLGYKVDWNTTWNTPTAIVDLSGVGFWQDMAYAIRHLHPQEEHQIFSQAMFFDNRTYVRVSFFETYTGRVERVGDEIIFYIAYPVP